jgi:hypothetical protein
MLQARHHWFIQAFFGWYFRFTFRRQFTAFVGEMPICPSNKAVCWLSNHSSWWDGVWPLLLNAQHEKRKFYVLMLEKELRKRQFLRALGAFSIAPGQRSVVESGQYLANLLHNQQNIVLLYPQGQIESMHERQIRFAPGMLRYACQVNSEINWLFSAFFVDYGAFSKPTVYHYHKLVSFDVRPSAEEINFLYQEFYEQQRQQQVKMMHKQHIQTER